MPRADEPAVPAVVWEPARGDPGTGRIGAFLQWLERERGQPREGGGRAVRGRPPGGGGGGDGGVGPRAGEERGRAGGGAGVAGGRRRPRRRGDPPLVAAERKGDAHAISSSSAQDSTTRPPARSHGPRSADQPPHEDDSLDRAVLVRARTVSTEVVRARPRPEEERR